MSVQKVMPHRPADPRPDGIIKLAVLAVGGQGGGVLIGWIETMARAAGYACQATSVAGVAQRTGSTLYYIELCAPDPAKEALPVFSLMPAAGDVDIMIAAEMMEAGRSIIRGFVTPDRTTLIASTHRALAVSEKMVPGDGIADAAEVMAAAELAARRLVAADFDTIAVMEGSVISASLFGALAATGALPFPREAFEAAIRAGGKGVDGSLRAFGAGHAAALAEASSGRSQPATANLPAAQGPRHMQRAWQALAARAAAYPAPVAEMALHGLHKVVAFQDLAYGKAYLARLDTVLAQDHAPYVLAREGAKYIANAMAYDDLIRVADLKTRAGRVKSIAGEMGAGSRHVMNVTEFLHPRAEEIVSLFPARFGARFAANPDRMARLDRFVNKGRRLRTDRLGAFFALYLIAGLRFWRPRTLRHANETAHLDDWLSRALGHVATNYDLAVEVIRCRRLIKGYSDTHARGLSKFDKVIAAIAMVKNRPDAAQWAARLREAALKDEEGRALEGAIATIRSFATKE